MRKVLTIAAAGMLCATMAAVASAESPKDPKARGVKGPTMTVVPSKRAIVPGGVVTVDVYISDVSDLSVYQTAMKVSGGDTGDLTTENIKIDTKRSDYVFGEAQVIKAEAMHSRQMGAMQMTGSVDVLRPAYLGTYTFRASPDAAGTFEIGLETGKSTFLRNSGGTAIAFRAGKAASVAVGAVTIDRVEESPK
jgi:hypothetical protein